MADDEQKLAVVRKMIDAWNTRDWQRVTDLFAEDGTLHSMMIDPVVGRKAIGERISAMGAGIDAITLKVAHIGLIDGLVFIERVDDFVFKGHAGAVPVVGVIEVVGDTIRTWREYYDRAALISAMGLVEDFH